MCADLVELGGDFVDGGGDVRRDGGAETGFFEGFVFVGRSLLVVVVGGFIGIGIAFGALEFIDGEEEEGGAFHLGSLEVLSHKDCGPRVFGRWLGHGNDGGDLKLQGIYQVHWASF